MFQGSIALGSETGLNVRGLFSRSWSGSITRFGEPSMATAALIIHHQ